MCHSSVMEFGKSHMTEAVVRGRRVLEVGSYDVNGSLRGHVVDRGPAEYVGIDIAEGPGVDLVCSACEIVARFGEASFDVIVSTEMLEHAGDWRSSINNMKSCLRVGGHLLLTTRSKGFPYHNPPDHWRFEVADMAQIFSDFETIELAGDYQVPGVVYFGKKLSSDRRDLSDIDVAVVTETEA